MLRSVLFSFLLLGLVHSQLNCPTLPPHTPKNVNDLRPDDIKVVMALGDSITAAFGLQGVKGGLNEYRGQSFSMGGDEGKTTFANYIKHYNPKVIGASLGQHTIEYCSEESCVPGQYRPKQDVFNAAQSGAQIYNLPHSEIEYLLKELKAHPEVDMNNDWKHLTILIGANDACSACGKTNTTEFAAKYEKYLKNTLDIVQKNIPRTFVSVGNLFNISNVYTVALKDPYCSSVHRVIAAECECIFQQGKKGDEARVKVGEAIDALNQVNYKIASQYKGNDEFVVVVQPVGENTDVNALGTKFLSTLDCFHPSAYAHEVMATAFWNNVLTPVAKKAKKLDPDAKPMCPDANTRLYTN